MTERAEWVLAELIGGPRDNTLLEIDESDLGKVLADLTQPTSTSSGRYVENPMAESDGDGARRYIDDERSAIARFGQGSPELYLQLIWTDPANVGPDAGPSAYIDPHLETTDLLTALLVGHEGTARRIVQRAEQLGSGPIETIDADVAPALRTIGERWQNGDLSMYVAHRASSIVRRIVADLAHREVFAKRGRAITAVLSGDLHGLPCEMATQALRDDGWAVEQLGPNTPAALLVDELEPGNVDLVVLSPTLPANQAMSRATADRLREKGLNVLVGEPGLTLAELQRQARASLA